MPQINFNPNVNVPGMVPLSQTALGQPQSPSAAPAASGSTGAAPVQLGSSFDLNTATQWFNQQIQQQQALQQQALQNQNVGSYGGSSSDAANWHSAYLSASNNINSLNTSLQNITQASQAGVDPTLLQQAMTQISSGLQSGNSQSISQATTNLTQQTAQQSQLNSQNQQLQAFDKNYQGQMFGTDANGNPLTLQQSLAGNTGTIGGLNQFESGQTAQTFNQLLQPEIQMALGGQGLQNSGASVELNSKALAGLQLAQQQSIMGAALGAQNQENALQQQAVMGNIAGQQGLVANTLGTNNAYTTMQFQQQLMQEQAQLAQQLSQYGGSSNNLGSNILTALAGSGAASLGANMGSNTLSGLGSLGSSLGSFFGGSSAGAGSALSGALGSGDLAGAMAAI